MKVVNCKGTSNEVQACCPNCGPWIDHWKNHTSDKTAEYFCNACGAMPGRDKTVRIVGAHVRNAEIIGQSPQYIVPLCDACNQRTDEFMVPDNTLVVANVSETCGALKLERAKQLAKFGIPPR